MGRSANMFYVYILQNLKGTLYIGQTQNVELRIKRHGDGTTRYTKSRGPWKMLFKQSFETRAEAMGYEKYLKSLKNPTFIKNSIIKV